MSDITHYDGCWQDERHHACAVREIERLRQQRDDFRRLYLETRENFEKSHAQRGARMQLLRSDCSDDYWEWFCNRHPEAAEWFDEDGVPR